MIKMTQLNALRNELQKSQWYAKGLLQQKLQGELSAILAHAFETVPFYQAFYKDICSHKTNWKKQARNIQDLPILTRASIQDETESLKSNRVPSAHGRCYMQETSGSTGRPVKILCTGFTSLYYQALMFREHEWHKRDCTKNLMSISWLDNDFALAPIGYHQNSWGSPFSDHYKTGAGVLINIASSTEAQAQAVLKYKPQYLITYPSQAVALLKYMSEHKHDVSFLNEIRLTGESLTDTYKASMQNCYEHIKLTDIYSCVEVGNIASQCEYGSYHVNNEHVYVEIVNDENKPCAIDEPGRVLLTTLTNYATPLIRYEVGDYASWGSSCVCGRKLPVIQKIHGRKRNRILLPNGESKFPYLGDRVEHRKISNDVVKFQFVQNSLEEIEYKAVTKKKLTPLQEAQLKKLCQKDFGDCFQIKISYWDELLPGPNGKFEEFVCLC